MKKNTPPRSIEDVIAELRNEQQLRMEALASGTPPDYPAYQKIVGAISGLGTAEQLLKDLLERMTNDDELGYSPPTR